MKDAREKLMQEAHTLLEDVPEKEKVTHVKPELLKVDDCQAQLKDTKEALVRLQAEFENYRKRTHKEKEETLRNASAHTLRRLLEIADEFELALAGMQKGEGTRGLEMLFGNLMTFLKREGVEEMGKMETFDPYIHECLKRDDGEEGKIIGVVKKGYLFKGNVLRHALVIVGNGKVGGN